MLEDANPVFTRRQPKQFKDGPGKTPHSKDLEPVFGMESNRMREQPHHKRRGQAMHDPILQQAATATEMKNDLRVSVRHDGKLRCPFTDIPAIVPKTFYRVAKLTRSFEFLVLHIER